MLSRIDNGARGRATRNGCDARRAHRCGASSVRASRRFRPATQRMSQCDPHRVPIPAFVIASALVRDGFSRNGLYLDRFREARQSAQKRARRRQ